jgi:hypothetical protein
MTEILHNTVVGLEEIAKQRRIRNDDELETI